MVLVLEQISMYAVKQSHFSTHISVESHTQSVTTHRVHSSTEEKNYQVESRNQIPCAVQGKFFLLGCDQSCELQSRNCCTYELTEFVTSCTRPGKA